MAVKLSAEVEEWIQRLVASGKFADADHVVESALSSLERSEPEYWHRLEELDAEADEDVQLGNFTRVDERYFESLRARVRAGTSPTES